MIDLIINVVWVGGGFLGLYPMAHKMAHAMATSFDEKPDAVDWCFAAPLSFFLMLVWPFAIAFVLIVGGTFMCSKRLWTGSWRLPWKTKERVA